MTTLPARAYWHALQNLIPLSRALFAKIITTFGTPQQAWHAPTEQWRVAGFRTAMLNHLARRTDVDPTQLWERFLESGITMLLISDPAYPPLLATIYDPPALLYCRGNLQLLTAAQLAVVGSRTPSSYGLRALHYLLPPLVQQGVALTSGLAIGIDSAAHRIALRNNGRTIAVLGSGIDDEKIYPRQHLHLAQQVAQQGLLISEFPPGTKAYKSHFPLRNRIIAGLSKATLVVEAAQKSGTKITAYAALQYNRDVLAVPGEIFNVRSVGTNELLRAGAEPITRPEDLFPLFGLTAAVDPSTAWHNLPMEQRAILERLIQHTSTFEELHNYTNFPAPALLALLTRLELSGLIQNIAGQFSLAKAIVAAPD